MIFGVSTSLCSALSALARRSAWLFIPALPTRSAFTLFQVHSSGLS